MIDFTKIPNIHYWTQRVLPCVFDESLSYVEKINKLEEEINKLIEEYNTFGQNVVTEINTFEEETTNQINTFIQQVTDEINTFKSDITNQLNTFETSMTNKQNAFETRILELTQEFETAINNDIATFKQTITAQQEEFENRVTEQNQQFMNQVNQSISDMQLIVDDIPSAVPQLVKINTKEWLQENAPAMIESSVANDVNKIFDVDNLIYVTHDESIEDLNNWTTTGIYYGTSLSTLSNYPANIVSGDMYWCFVGHTGTNAVERTIQQTLYLNDGSCFTRAYVNTSNAWDLWIRVSNTNRVIGYNTEVDFNTFFFTDKNYGLNDTWTGVYQLSKWSNAPSDLIESDVVIVNKYDYTASGNLYSVQVVTKINSHVNNFKNLGKIWTRKRLGTVWSPWVLINYENLMINKTLNGIDVNSITESNIITCDSASGAINTNLPNSYLTNGHYYIQTIKNSDTEILQYLYNTGDYGANIYSRQKNGNTWSVWRAIVPNVRYEETTNFTLSGANPSYENYYPTSISTIGLPDENIFGGFEVQAIVNIDGKSSNPTPMLYNANLVYNANSPNVITIGFKVFDYESQAGKFYVKFRVLDWR
jgi:hypothetical protein